MINTTSLTIVETVSGKQIDLQNPQPENITLSDIAWHLSRIQRFTGATRNRLGVNVAAHSLFVCAIVNQMTHSNIMSLHGLLHDAHEAYIGDITKPVKMLPGVDDLLARYTAPLQACIHSALGVPEISADEYWLIKYADNIALAYEASQFMHSKGNGWGLEAYANASQLDFEIWPCFYYRMPEKTIGSAFEHIVNTLRLTVIH